VKNRRDSMTIKSPGAGSWRGDDEPSDPMQTAALISADPKSNAIPNPLDQSKLLEFLGQINYRILTGNQLYIESDGTAYRVLYGCYWRSVYSGVEHYSLKCEPVNHAHWMDETARSEIDLAIQYSSNGWSVSGCSLKFMALSE
jgi:hypothetical protein